MTYVLRILHTLRLFTLAAMFVFTFVIHTLAQAQEHNFEYRPTLLLDGEALAEELSRWIVSQRPSGNVLKRLTTIELPSLKNGVYIKFDPQSYEIQRLDQWMMSQPDNSVDPKTFFTTCLRLMNLNIQDGLILAWDYLSNDWPNALERNNFPSSKKLIDITGEYSVYDGSYHFRPILNERGEPELLENGVAKLQLITTKRGDKRGAWYHFAGTALAAYTYDRYAFGLDHPVYTDLLITIEKLFFHRASGIANAKRIALDRAGAFFGFHLMKRLKLKADEVILNPQQRRELTPTFVERPDLFGPDYVLRPGQRPKDFGTELTSEHPFYRDFAYLQALTYHHLFVSPLALNPVRLFLSSDGEIVLKLLEQYQRTPLPSQKQAQFERMLGDVLKLGPQSRFSMQDLDVTFYHLTPESQERVRDGWSRFAELSFAILNHKRGPSEQRERLQEIRRAYDLAAPQDPIYYHLIPPGHPRACQSLFDLAS